MLPSPHRHTVATIDLTAIRDNIQAFKDYTQTPAQIWAVIKANAYGHGSIEVARATFNQVHGFCVSNLDEAMELREAGIDNPILILSGIPPIAASLARKYDITLTAPNLDWLKLVIQTNPSPDLWDLKIHIAVDSGMGRIGSQSTHEVNQMIQMIDQSKMDFEGIFTHFATADEANTDYFDQQVLNFQDLVSGLIRRPRYVHTTNSAAGIWHPNQIQDIERLGLVIYGLNPSNQVMDVPFSLKPALSLRSEITQCKKISAGQSVGYGATFTADSDTYIGTTSIGYADGWTRDTQGFHVLVAGKFCPIVGRVSMDQMTILLKKPVPLGTPVTLIGIDGSQEITMDDLATHRQTINYEVACLLSDRIYRYYPDQNSDSQFNL